LGIAFAFIGLAALAYTLISWIAGNTVEGWTSLASIVLIMGSVQLIVLGIMGEYLGRMYIESKRRPLYIVNEVVGGGLDD
jgi:dolichol-phosphate mannosyltransferase